VEELTRQLSPGHFKRQIEEMLADLA